MSRNQSRPLYDPYRAIKKFFLSGFVVLTFIAYVVYERLIRPDSTLPPGAASAAAAPATLAPFTGANGALHRCFHPSLAQPLAPVRLLRVTGMGRIRGNPLMPTTAWCKCRSAFRAEQSKTYSSCSTRMTGAPRNRSTRSRCRICRRRPSRRRALRWTSSPEPR